MAKHAAAGPAKGKQRRAQKMQDKRERILRAAVQLFASKGFHYTHTGEIARQADIATGTLYLYFRSKDEVLLAAYEETMLSFITNVQALVEGAAGPERKLRDMIHLHLRTLEASPDVAHVLLIEVRQTGPEVKRRAFEIIERYMHFIRRLIAEGVTQGAFKAIEPEIAAEMILGALEQLALRWLRGKSSYSLAAIADAAADIFISGLRG